MKSILKSLSVLGVFLILSCNVFGSSRIRNALLSSEYDLTLSYAYPVPFNAYLGDKEITFMNLASVCDIKVYNMAGDLIKTIHHTNGEPAISWDVKDDNGKTVPNGLYIYIITSIEDKKEGKIIVIK